MSPRLLIASLMCAAAVLLVAGLAYFGDPKVEGEGLADALSANSVQVQPEDGGTATEEQSVERAPAGVKAPIPATRPARITGGGNVLLGLASIEDGREREAFLERVIGRLAALGPDAALAQVQQLEDAELRDMAMLALLQEWSGVNTLELIRSGKIWRFGVEGALGLHLLEDGKITPERAAEMALATRDANRRSELLAQVASQLAGTNPGAAMALADGLDERQKARFIERVAANLAEQSPAAAREMVARSTDPAARAAMMARILEVEARQDPAGAARNFLSQPPETPQGQQQAARGIGSRWASQDTLAALQWADSLSDDSLRNAARQGIQAVAPVGIGAQLSPGAGGVPVLQDMVAGGPASASGQLRNGDAILAVSSASGQWVDSRSVQMGELIGLIRGEPNTQVSLQVQSPGETVPRMVTLGRQQIIYRPQ